MPTFASQFDRARPYAAAYAGEPDDPTWRSPAVAAAALAGSAVVGVVGVVAGAAAVEAVADSSPGWGENWDAGWEAPEPGELGDAGGGAWTDRGDYTDAGVGGDGESFYFIDGDSSLMIE